MQLCSVLVQPFWVADWQTNSIAVTSGIFWQLLWLYWITIVLPTSNLTSKMFEESKNKGKSMYCHFERTNETPLCFGWNSVTVIKLYLFWYVYMIFIEKWVQFVGGQELAADSQHPNTRNSRNITLTHSWREKKTFDLCKKVTN